MLKCDVCGASTHPMKATRWGSDLPPNHLCPGCVSFARGLFVWPLLTALAVVMLALLMSRWWEGDLGAALLVVGALVTVAYQATRALVWRGRPRRVDLESKGGAQ